MYFFVDTIMPNQKTGIEHAAINRLKLFKQNKAAVKIVTRNYDRTFHQYLASVGLLDSDILNMFDFFQQATQFKSRKFGINDLPQIANQNIKHNSPNKDNNYLTYQIYESEMLELKCIRLIGTMRKLIGWNILTNLKIICVLIVTTREDFARYNN